MKDNKVQKNNITEVEDDEEEGFDAIKVDKNTFRPKRENMLDCVSKVKYALFQQNFMYKKSMQDKPTHLLNNTNSQPTLLKC